MVEARAWEGRLATRSFGKSFQAVFRETEEIPLFSLGISEQRHQDYQAAVRALGATVSPLTQNLHRWVQVVWQDGLASEVLQHIAYGAQVLLTSAVKPFTGTNYVPDEDTQWILSDLEEEVHAGRFAPAEPSFFTYFAPIGVVTRQVDGEVKKRKVHNFSAPFGDDSFNTKCEADKKKFATVQQAANLLRPKAYMAKIDLHKAFRYVGMDLELFKYLGSQLSDLVAESCPRGRAGTERSPVFQWAGPHLCLQDTRMPMGMKSSPGIFHEITSIIARRLRAEGVTTVVYLDDFLVIGATEEECARGFNLLFDLVRWLGFDVSPSKVTPPTKYLTFLGVDLNTDADGDGAITLALSAQKVQRLIGECATLTRNAVTIKAVESLLGRMNFAAQVIPFASAYMASGFAALARARRCKHRTLTATRVFLAD